jgi:hypothetical protein
MDRPQTLIELQEFAKEQTDEKVEILREMIRDTEIDSDLRAAVIGLIFEWRMAPVKE